MPTDTINSLAAAVNSAKLDSVKSMFSAELSEKVEEALKDIRSSTKNVQYTVNDSKQEGDHLAFTYTVAGTSTATGKSGTWTGSGIATLTGGKIAHLRVHEDYIAKALALGNTGAFSKIAGPIATGTWVGTASGFTVTLTLTQTSAAISGTVAVSGFPGTYPITGQNSYPNHPNLTLHAEITGLAVEFEGDFNGNNQAAGKLTITGFPAIDVTIDRKS
jgi:hypothetical protein